jgi:hypothetical protein
MLWNDPGSGGGGAPGWAFFVRGAGTRWWSWRAVGPRQTVEGHAATRTQAILAARAIRDNDEARKAAEAAPWEQV